MKTKNKILSVVPFLILFSTIFGVGLYFGNTEECIYIRSSSDIYKIREHLDSKFVFSCDKVFITTESWKPIGTDETPFRGTIIGNGVQISFTSGEMKSVPVDNMSLCGFFGVNTGIISGLNIYVGGTVSNDDSSNADCFGAIAAINKGTIANCSVTGPGQFKMNKKRGDFCFGGIAGVNSGRIMKSSFGLNCTFSSDSFTNMIYGSIVGKAESSEVEQCISLGKASSFSSFRQILCGGLIGVCFSKNNSLYNCASYTVFNLTNNSFVSGSSGCSLVEQDSELTIRNCYLCTRNNYETDDSEKTHFNTGLFYKKMNIDCKVFAYNCFANYFVSESSGLCFSFSNSNIDEFDNLYYSTNYNENDNLFGKKTLFSNINLEELGWSETIWEKTSNGFWLR